MLTEKERLLKLLRNERVDRPPFLSPGGMMNMAISEVMNIIGCYWPEAHINPEMMARLAIGMHDLGRIENVGAPFCMTVEAEAFGAKVELGNLESLPCVIGYPIENIKEFENLKPIRLNEKSRVDTVLKAVEILSSNTKDIPIIGNLTGPVSLATSLIEPNKYLRSILREKEDVHRFMDFVTENLIEFASLLVKKGADVILIADPTATGEILGAKNFKDFCLKYINKITEFIENELNTPTIIHICGRIDNIYPELAELKSNTISIDSITNIQTIKENLPHKKIMGNVSTFTLERGSAEKVSNLGFLCIKNGVDILAPACGLGPKTPLANIKALAQTVIQT